MEQKQNNRTRPPNQAGGSKPGRKFSSGSNSSFQKRRSDNKPTFNKQHSKPSATKSFDITKDNLLGNTKAINQPRAKNPNQKPAQGTVNKQSAQPKGPNQNNAPQRTSTKKFSNRRPGQKSKYIPKQKVTIKTNENALKIIPIGGCEEVGRNMTVFEYKKDIVILDMGIQFPEEDMPGIDYIIPNVDYLVGKEKQIKGVILSHGHLDHIGAAAILLEKLGNPPIIARDMTISMVKHRVEDYKKGSSKGLKIINIKDVKDKLKLGQFNVEFFQIEHSVRDAVGVILKTPEGTVIHPGDWTLEKDEQGRPNIDYTHLADLPKPTVLMLESLGVVDIRKSSSQQDMEKNLESLMTHAHGRTIIGTFSSQTERIGWILETAQRLGKKVALDGYSMKMNVEIAKELGYIKVHKDTMIPIEQVSKHKDNKIIVLCTGAQGEGNAALSRIISGEHRYIKLRKSDTMILSSSIIPGNERTIQRLKDNLYRQCDNVIHGTIMDIHVSGHGNRDDIAYMIKQIKPTYFMPVYANHYMLKEASKLAQNIGFNASKIFVPDNGSILEIYKSQAKMLEQKVPSDYVFVDGLGITDSNNIVIRDRQMMAEDGMLVIIATIRKKTGELIQNPDLISRGFVYMKENRRLIEMTRQKAKKILKDADPKTSMDDSLIREKLRNEIGKFLFQKTEKRPMILPVIIAV